MGTNKSYSPHPPTPAPNLEAQPKSRFIGAASIIDHPSSSSLSVLVAINKKTQNKPNVKIGNFPQPLSVQAFTAKTPLYPPKKQTQTNPILSGEALAKTDQTQCNSAPFFYKNRHFLCVLSALCGKKHRKQTQFATLLPYLRAYMAQNKPKTNPILSGEALAKTEQTQSKPNLPPTRSTRPRPNQHNPILTHRTPLAFTQLATQ